MKYDEHFDQWLESQAWRVMQKVADGHGLRPEEWLILLLRAQARRFATMNQDLRDQMAELRRGKDGRSGCASDGLGRVEKRSGSTDKP